MKKTIYTISSRMEEKDILVIFSQIVSAIRYMHSKNVLHRDLKTANIFLTKDVMVKIGDFGISKVLTTQQVGVNILLIFIFPRYDYALVIHNYLIGRLRQKTEIILAMLRFNLFQNILLRVNTCYVCRFLSYGEHRVSE